MEVLFIEIVSELTLKGELCYSYCTEKLYEAYGQRTTLVDSRVGELFVIVFRLVRDVVANHKTTRYAGAATKVIQKNHLA